MAKKTIRHSPVNNDYEEVVVVSKIVRFTKSNDGENTIIKMDNGEELLSCDSINTLEARYERSFKDDD